MLLYRFGNVEVDPSGHCLKRDGIEQHVRPQVLQVLLYLIEQRHRVVPKQELIEKIWKLNAVTDDALAQVISDIRKAIGDDSRQPHLIKTVPKIGYRFIGPLEELQTVQTRPAEFQEITTFEVEYEEDADSAEQVQAALPPPQNVTLQQLEIPARMPARRARFTSIIAILLAAAGLYYAIQTWWIPKERVSISAPAIAGKKSIVVLYFDNRSNDPQLDWLREGIPDMLITGLSRSKKLSLLSRQQLHLILAEKGMPEPHKITLDEAVRIAQKSRAEVIVAGSFTTIGQNVRIDVQIQNGQNGQLLAAEQLVLDKPEQILTQIDLLSLKIASHLGEQAELKPGFSTVMTNNLEAYRYYSVAVEKAQALHNQEAIELLKKAVALDPQFAMAHARIGYAYGITGNLPEQAKSHLEKAFKLSDRLTEKDRLYITAWYALANADFENATRVLKQLIHSYPLEVEAYLRLGQLMIGEGNEEEAIEVYKRALAFNPETADVYNHLGGLYARLGRYQEAIPMLQRHVQISKSEPNAHDTLGLGFQAAGRYSEAITEYERALELDPKFEVAVVHLGNAYFQMGRYKNALEQYARYIDMAPSDYERSRGYGCIAHVYWKSGNSQEARTAMEMEKKYSGNRIPMLVLTDDLGSIQQEDEFRRALEPWNKPMRGSRADMRSYYYILGRRALKARNQQQAIDHFKKSLEYPRPIWNINDYEDGLANGYLEFNRLPEAIAEYDRILRLNPNYPLAHYGLAQAYERTGNVQKSRDHYAKFLEVWSDADPDLPEIKTAKRRVTIR